MNYMFLIYAEEPDTPPSDSEMKRWTDFQDNAAKIATHVAGNALQPVATATTVSVRNGETITTDGPFADTKEHLGGYYIFDCKDLDVALGIAATIPSAPVGHVEVRPVVGF